MINLSNTLKKKNNKKGFTLIELIVVIAILGILAALAIPRFSTVTENAQRKAFEANHRIAASAIQMAIADNNGTVPAAIAADANGLEDYIDGGILSLQGDPVAGASYVWNGTNLTSNATIGGTAETPLVYVP